MNDIENLKCWFNGKFCQLKDVHISILDFGFIHSDATYDVMRSRNGRILNFQLHHERFLKSCNYFDFQSVANLREIGERLLEENQIDEGFVWVCVWRGRPPSGNPREANVPQNSVVYVKPYYGLKSTNDDLKLKIVEEHRRVPSSCYSQESKNFGWIEFNLAQRKAFSRGFDSALLLNPDGDITEGPGFGVCFFDGKQVLSPEKDCLNSVTIQVIANLCESHKIPFKRTRISKKDLENFEGAFACSTSGGVTPISQIDGHSFKKCTFDLSQMFNDYLETQDS